MKPSATRNRCARAFLCVAVLLTGRAIFAAESAPAVAAATPLPRATTNGGIRSITLPHFEPEMPIAPGRDEFMIVCVSCHSPRYVTMQPAFPRLQWQETVAKMIKVYGAPANEEQSRAIVDYLTAVHGTGPGAMLSASAADDEESALAAPPAARPAETYPLLNVAGDPEERARQASRGAALFQENCAGCHGAAGRGDGVISPVLLRKPANLAAARFATSLLSQVLWNGVRGTSMPSWRNLPENDPAALAAFVETLHPPANPEQPAAESLARGRVLFQKNCAVCHGPEGDAKSATAATLAPAPANLKWIQPDRDFILTVLEDGIPGTAMPSWKAQLSEADRGALADFVRSLFEAPN